MFKKIPVPSKNLYEFLKIVGVDQLAGGVVHLNRRAYARAIARENYCVIVMTSFLLLSHLAKMECEDCKCSFMKISKVNSKRHTHTGGFAVANEQTSGRHIRCCVLESGSVKIIKDTLRPAAVSGTCKFISSPNDVYIKKLLYPCHIWIELRISKRYTV